MTDLETKIYQAVASGNGPKGVEIASLIGAEKQLVNSTLAHSDTLKAHIVQDRNYRWWLRNKDAQSTSSQGNSTVAAADSDLRNLCNYYLNCIALESSSSVSQFLTGHYGLNYALLHGLELNPERDEDAIQFLKKVSTDKNKTVYLGYPVRVFTIWGKYNTPYKKIAPVFMFSINYHGGQAEIASIPTINMEVIRAFTQPSTEALVNELISLENELGLDAEDVEIEKDELALRLAEIRSWDYKERIDPYHIPSTYFDASTEDGIYNRAIVIETERKTYTQGLESELMVLSNMPASSYRGTALYSWIKGEHTAVSGDSIKPLLEVLPLNLEQADAVNTALRSDLTIITGPPGTGKSQVVTDLLINIIWNGKSALFSSKNNKAVDVVDARVNGLCKRPVLLRIGSNQYASRLAEIIEGLLNSRPNKQDIADAEFYLKEYKRKSKEIDKIAEEKKATMAARNHLDDIEQEYCVVRDRVGKWMKTSELPAEGEILQAAKNYDKAHEAATREKQSFFIKLFWPAFSKKRKELEFQAAQAYDRYAKKYEIMSTADTVAHRDSRELVKQAEGFEEALKIGRSYKQAFDSLKNTKPMEQSDGLLMTNKQETASIAQKLWGKWLVSQVLPFSANDREEMTAFVTAMKLTGNVDLSEQPELRKKYSKMTQQMTKYLKCWAVTSLSAKNRIPFEAGYFDYLIIDEASQCDIASILPLLYRAKRAVIIGDPKQLSHISQLSRKQDLALLNRYHIEPNWSYSTNSLYALASGKVAVDQIVQLKDHFRCCADIIEFSNEEFYDGSLRTATKYSGLKTPPGEKPGIRWIDIDGQTVRPTSGSAYNLKEAEAVVKELNRLVSIGYQGTIGVVTPFTRQAALIREILEKQENKLTYEKLLLHHEFIADTVHKFQGDERDLMIFSSVVSHGAADSTLGYLSSQGNLFNVAITRARAVLVVIGNHQYCSQSSVSYLRDFAEYCKKLSFDTPEIRSIQQIAESREYPWVANPEQVSDWERVFYTALYDAGIQTIPQYSVEKYKLDLAVILDNTRKLDIEIDGEMYHKQWNGELCYRDQLRNQRMFELGWDVKRFWVYQIRDDMDWCIGQIKQWMADHAS